MKIVRNEMLELEVKKNVFEKYWYIWMALFVISTSFTVIQNTVYDDVIPKVVRTKIIQKTDSFYVLDKDLKYVPKNITQNIPISCNNPGNITRGNPNADKYAIGVYKVGKYEFLVFPSVEHGYKALKEVLKTYGNSTIAKMLDAYCPGHVNYLGLFKNPNKLVKDEDQDHLCKIIAQKEGFK